MDYDVIIVGGGPAGTTCGTLLKKYAPHFRVLILEKESFPRDHVGESQLPKIGSVLQEMGVWEKVESANFPIKIGATYRWGQSDDLWDFNFLPHGVLAPEERPAAFEGQRTQTAFQVDRAVYDKILLDHSAEMGCEVREETRVKSVLKAGKKIVGVRLADESVLTAKYYIDASGNAAILRRALGVPVEEPSTLKNVAFWDYWQNADWAVEIGVGGTRIQIMSLGYGWIWFIPLSPTRTSIGFVCHAETFKTSGKTPEQLYHDAIQEEPRIRGLLENAICEGNFAATKDWSFVVEEMADENWMLVGETVGFADPILSAGLTITHISAREAAYTLLELEKGGDKEWLFAEYTRRNRRRVLQHIRFADYWYAANAHFSELKEFTREIAAEAGLDLDADNAFQWLGTGGFVEEDMTSGGVAAFSFNALHGMNDWLSGQGTKFAYGGYNYFQVNLHKATKVQFARYEDGKIEIVDGYERDGKILPVTGMIGRLLRHLKTNPQIMNALKAILVEVQAEGNEYNKYLHDWIMQSLEALVRDGWVKCKVVPGVAPLPESSDFSLFVSTNNDDSFVK
jgi:flavin-dependent dehydrogenase